MHETFLALLTDIHQSIDRVADDLSRDRPDLATALRVQAAWIPRPEEIDPASDGGGERACRRLRPLLYRALDEGVLDGDQFDRMMLRQNQARRALGKRRC
jgi:hypothetical protein